MKFLRNCWYMVGWSSEFSANDIVPFTIMNEALALYRKDDGTLVALEDLCPHRLVPLSVGRKEGDELRCMYHGLKFAADGRCTEIPGTDRISSKVCVRSYPVQEKHGAAWVWMGDPAKADVSLIPPIEGPDSTVFAMKCSKKLWKGNAELVADNLLDLSHAPYVHEATFGANNKVSLRIQKDGEAKRGIDTVERGVVADRWHLGRPSNPYFGEIPSDDNVVSTFLVPGVFILKIHSYAPGVQDRLVDGKPAEEPIFRRCTCQMVTPINDTETMFFYNFGPDHEHAHLADHAFAIAEAAFAEDKAIIETQQATISRVPERKMMMLVMDQPVLRYNEIFNGFHGKEQAEQLNAHSAT